MDTGKCIWMDAGVVDYQLCPLKQNCDLCDFHQEMIRGCRTHSPQTDTLGICIQHPEMAPLQFTPGLQHVRGHFWYKRVADGRIRVGIDAFLWQLFTSVHKIVTPNANTDLINNQCFGWLVLNDGIVYMRTPISGRIIQSNPLFRENGGLDPHLYLAPEPELWFMELETQGIPDIDRLGKEKYMSNTLKDITHFKKLIHKTDESVPTELLRRKQINRNDFSKYLRIISDDRIFIC